MHVSASLMTVESMANMSRSLKRERNPLTRFGGMKPGEIPPSFLMVAQYTSSATSAGRVLFACENVLRFPGVAPRMSLSRLSFSEASSHISVRHDARERCPRTSMTKWLVAENFRASTPCALAVRDARLLFRDHERPKSWYN